MNQNWHKTSTLKQVLELLKLEPKSILESQREHFVHSFLESIPAADIVGRKNTEILNICLLQWGLMQSRSAGNIAISIFDPNHENADWHSNHSIVALINDDMPFLVDSATAYFNEQGFSVHLLVHPIFDVQRNHNGDLISISDVSTTLKGERESCILFEVDRISDDQRREKLKHGLIKVLTDVRLAVTDWHPMLEQLNFSLAELSEFSEFLPDGLGNEAADFISWMYDNNFTFLGHRKYDIDISDNNQINYTIVPNSSLGVLRNQKLKPLGNTTRNEETLDELTNFISSTEPLMITKANIKSTVHRPVLMDSVGIKKFDLDGAVVGETRFVGLFTSTAYSSPVSQIPLLRRKVNTVLNNSGFQPGGHDFKALEHVLQSLPRDELFQISDSELEIMALGVFALEERQRPGLLIRRDPLERFISCLVYIPRERYNTDLRTRIQWILEVALGGKIGTYTTQMSSSALARVHYIIQTKPGKIPHYNIEDIEESIVDNIRSWDDRLIHLIDKTYTPLEVSKIASRYASGFSAAYREDFSPSVAAQDIHFLEAATLGGDLSLYLYRQLESNLSAINLKIYNLRDPLPLSDILPKLEKMGLRVISERPYRVRARSQNKSNDKETIWIHDLLLHEKSNIEIDIDIIRDNFGEALKRVWAGDAEDDGFNSLVVRAGLSWNEVVIFRAIAKYLRQVGAPFSQAYMEETLCKHADVTSMLTHYFISKFDPNNSTSTHEDNQRKRIEIITKLDDVLSLDEDRIIRRFLNVIDSTLRTNYFQNLGVDINKPYLSFKLDSARLDQMPLPRPYVEVFVYSPRFEGIHLRGGKIARGGIRWSDRREDFRTEILNLMKAQMVKNAVIVPVGAKGGFVVKRFLDNSDRNTYVNEGMECYSMFISALLELTDNIVSGEVVLPKDIVAYDQTDSYLVVAADKGTATFSDIANDIANKKNFWLGDAFASGGKDGYDHKKMGITARGAWESVKRHFRELGKNIENDVFTVIGVGDMSGDVFGNGMLQSKHTKLLAAFNHNHIFIDPNPDPIKSFKERERLFYMPNSNWGDYNKEILSPGGQILDRASKFVNLSPEVCKLLNLNEKRLTTNDLIRCLLVATIDLIWFGGIGCYVKATKETHEDTGDRGNDLVRVDASKLSCKIIGEGANLALTQPGRIEFALNGGYINTDAIDNSAGVDCSDHEVNIKILLNNKLSEGRLNLENRNNLLESMTNDIASLVTKNNYLQTQALSVELTSASTRFDSYERLMRALESAGHLNRKVESLPSEELLSERLKNGLSLTRPELAVLLASAKISVFSSLVDTDIYKDTYLAQDLERYFPSAIVDQHPELIPQHTLKREIIATSVANSMLNRAGCYFVNEMVEATNQPVSEIARAYAAARHVFSLRELWIEIESLDNKITPQLQMTLLAEARRLLEHGTLWFLGSREKSIDVTQIINDFSDGVASLGEVIEEVLSPEKREKVFIEREELVSYGVPEGVARMIAAVDPLLSACDIVEISETIGMEVKSAAAAYFAVGAEFRIDWLRDQIEELHNDNHWQQRAVKTMAKDLFSHQRLLSIKILQTYSDETSVENAMKAWRDNNSEILNKTSKVLDEVRSSGKIDLSMLAIANAEIRMLIGN